MGGQTGILGEWGARAEEGRCWSEEDRDERNGSSPLGSVLDTTGTALATTTTTTYDTAPTTTVCTTHDPERTSANDPNASVFSSMLFRTVCSRPDARIGRMTA